MSLILLRRAIALGFLSALVLVAVAIGFGVVGSAREAKANHIAAPKELTIFHSGVCTAGSTPSCTGQLTTPLSVAVGGTFTVQANATVDAPTANGSQWMFVWLDAVLDVGLPTPAAGPPTDLDTDHTSCFAPFAPSGLTVGVQGLGGGCAAGATNSTPIVSIPLTCLAAGTTVVALAGLDIDAVFGSTLDTLNVPGTILENQVPNVDGLGGTAGAPATVAGFTVTCGTPPPATNTPIPTVTPTATSTRTPGPTATPCVTNCPTQFPSAFTRTPTPLATRTATPSVPATGQTPGAPPPTARGGGAGVGIVLPGTGSDGENSNRTQALAVVLLVSAMASIGGGVWYKRRGG